MEEDICAEVLDYLQTELELQLRNDIAPEFWKYFKNIPNDQSQDNVKYKDHTSNNANNVENHDKPFPNAVKELHANVTKLMTYAQRMDQIADYLKKVIIC